MDNITIKNIEIETIIGTRSEERYKKQKIIVSYKIFTSLQKAGISDSLADTIDYFTMTDNIKKIANESAFFLLEKLAEEIANNCLKTSAAAGIEVTISKPQALEGSISTSITIQRGDFFA